MALNILRSYAQKAPSELPSSVLFSYTSNSLTIYDAFPKSIFHFLVLPRVRSDSSITLADLSNLKTLLKCDRALAKEVIVGLKQDAETLRKEIEDEMIKRYGFRWPLWTGFHAVPSMAHCHLHVLSADLCSPKMKHKKHYNSFHPKVGFFIDIDEILSWFDAEPSYLETMAELNPKTYEALLKEDLSCWHCSVSMKNMPKLKEHLQEEWDKLATREKAKLDRKEKLDAKRHAKEIPDDDEHASKRRKADVISSTP